MPPRAWSFHMYIVVGLEENLFPSQMALNTREEFEEERRLFYVALTRAEKKATLSYALTRYRWGQLIQNEPSRFIEEMDERYLLLPTVSAKRPEPFDFNNARTSFYKPMPSGASAPPKPGMKKVGRRPATGDAHKGGSSGDSPCPSRQHRPWRGSETRPIRKRQSAQTGRRSAQHQGHGFLSLCGPKTVAPQIRQTRSALMDRSLPAFRLLLHGPSRVQPEHRRHDLSN